MSVDPSGLRVAIVTDISPEERSRYWIEALSALRDLGVEPHLVTVREPGTLHREAEPICAGRLALGARRARNYAGAARRLRRYVRVEHIDIVHASEPIPGLIAAIARGSDDRAAWLFQRRHVTTNRKQDLFTAVASARADRVLSISRAVSRAVLADHVAPSKLREVGNGVVTPALATEMREVGRASLGISPDAVVVACVARIRAGKGHDVLIDACGQLAAEGWPGGDALHLVLVGDGPEANEIGALAAGYPGFETHLTGWVDDTERWMAVADVVAVPSLTEPFGKSAVEAMALRTPLVASQVGGLIDLLDGDRNGIGVRPGDPTELASAIRRTLTESEGTAARVIAARSAYEERYTMQAMVERWGAIYAEITDARLNR